MFGFNSWILWRVLVFQAIQILQENGIETEAMVNDFRTARNQSSSDAEVAEAQESLVNLSQQVQGEILNNPRMMEWMMRSKPTIDESLREIYEEAYEVWIVREFAFKTGRSDIHGWSERKLEHTLRKFLEVETALNDLS